ncbi:uncharacterized protein [Haliotis cracherodii]|uniref:uncharacterized protein n=1 Tax=Haliotis cracherodii TaxID=6455 RepID=UPI0039EBC41C
MLRTIVLLVAAVTLAQGFQPPSVGGIFEDKRPNGSKPDVKPIKVVPTGTMTIKYENESYDVSAESFQTLAKVFGLFFDKNHDGIFAALPEGLAVYGEVDKDGNNGLSPEEIAASPLVNWKDKMATDENGLVTDEEFFKLIGKFDLNKDGSATLPEIIIYTAGKKVETP